MNALEQAPGDVLPIGDERAHSFWVEQKMQHVLQTRARSHIDEARGRSIQSEAETGRLLK
jgi:hypothetical protein